MKRILLSITSLLLALPLFAQEGSNDTLTVATPDTVAATVAETSIMRKVEIRLWPEGAPDYNGIYAPEEDHQMYVINVTDPVLTVYVPKNPKRIGIIACPGGSYLQVWQGTEGHNMAEWYCAQGYTYAVLKCRLPNGYSDVPLTDVQRSFKLMKERREEFQFDKLGIQGCSAGGHLASTAATHYGSDVTRPDFQILFYPVVSFNKAFTHQLSADQLIGPGAAHDQVQYYSNELQVTAQTPPAFITHSTDDTLVPVKNSEVYYRALRAKGVHAEMYLYPEGGHGWFGNENFPYRSECFEKLRIFIDTYGK